MKVHELIAALQQQNPEHEVLYYDGDFGLMDLEFVNATVYDKDEENLWNFDVEGEPDETDNTEPIVLIEGRW